MREGALVWRHIPGLLGEASEGVTGQERGSDSSRGAFASMVVLGGKISNQEPLRGSAAEGNVHGLGQETRPSAEQFLKHPLALLALVPKDAALFAAGAAAGALAKTVTAPLDRIKLLMQVGARHLFSPHLYLLERDGLLVSSIDEVFRRQTLVGEGSFPLFFSQFPTPF